MSTSGIRWQQRLGNHGRALKQLQSADALAADRELSDLERPGMIQAGVVRAALDGSRAEGTFRAGSDIDLALFGDGLTAGKLLAIDVGIDDLDLPDTVDPSLFEQIENAALRSQIERVGQDLYRRVAAKAG